MPHITVGSIVRQIHTKNVLYIVTCIKEATERPGILIADLIYVDKERTTKQYMAMLCHLTLISKVSRSVRRDLHIRTARRERQR